MTKKIIVPKENAEKVLKFFKDLQDRKDALVKKYQERSR